MLTGKVSCGDLTGPGPFSDKPESSFVLLYLQSWPGRRHGLPNLKLSISSLMQTSSLGEARIL